MLTTNHFYIQYELCSLLFLLLIAIRFFSMRRFPNRANRLFGSIILCAFADIALDVIGSYTIMRASHFPIWVNYAINTPFYALQIIFPVLMMAYIIYASGKNFRTEQSLVFLLIPAVIFLSLLATNAFSRLFFYMETIEGVTVYQHGEFFITLYLGTFFYILATLFLTNRYRADLDKKIRVTIWKFTFIVVIAVVLQFLFPEYLLTGVSLALAIMMMFFTIQNPDDMLDLISGVFNYNAMMAYLDANITRDRPIRFVVIDIDGIRRVNSSYGLSAGNETFSCIGAFFNGLGSNLWAFRMIGSRFLLVSTRSDGFRQAIFKIYKWFEQPWFIGENELSLTAKIRFYDSPELFSSPEEVIELVDMVFSDDSSCSFGQNMRISRDLLSINRRWTQIEDAVREALRHGNGLSLHYQPIYNVHTGGYSSAEALLRLYSPELGNISPAEFIPIIEKSGLILQIDEFVLHTACEFLTRHPALEMLELNLSAVEFHRNPRQHILTIIEKYHVDPHRICFEVTETAAVRYPGILEKFMKDMIARGFRFALDDFGTGYANITQVTSLPFAIAKIDKTLLADDPRSRAVFDSVVRMFSLIGISTVVEGVETAECAANVCQKADYIQGYYYSRPLPEDKYNKFIVSLPEQPVLSPIQ